MVDTLKNAGETKKKLEKVKLNERHTKALSVGMSWNGVVPTVPSLTKAKSQRNASSARSSRIYEESITLDKMGKDGGLEKRKKPD